MTVSLSESKRQIPKEAKIMKKIIIKPLAKLIRKLEAALPGMQPGRLYLWHLHQSKNTAFKKIR